MGLMPPVNSSLRNNDMTDERCVITPDEAESLLADGEYVHNYTRGPFMLGADWPRAEAIAALRAAAEIEIGGPSCKAMGHPLAVHEPTGRVSFFAADMAKVEAFEAARGVS